MISRLQVATNVADRLAGDRAGAVRQAAAWLLDTGRTAQAKYLAGDVASILAQRGYVSVTVTTARPLSGAALEQIKAYIRAQTGGRELELSTAVDPALIGGIRLETPDAALDATVKTKLAKFVEGVAHE